LAIQGLIPPAPAAAKQVEKLTTILHTKFVSAGIGGMASTSRSAGSEGTNGSGTIVLSGVTGPVTKALLYWHGPTAGGPSSVNAGVRFNGNDINGINIGTSSDNCWGFANSQAYRADVTSFVTGDGNYALANFQKKDGNTVIADTNGASLIVFFDDPTTADLRDVTIFDGNDSDVHNDTDSDGWSASLNGIRYPGGGATLELHVSDGQDPSEGALLLDNGTPPTTQLAPAGAIFSGNAPGTRNINPNALGSLWDVATYDITSSMTPGVNNLTLSLSHQSDCISLVVALVSVPTPIKLTPVASTQSIVKSQTVTATIAPPAEGRSVRFTVEAGPNVGVTGSATTNASGQATFTYTSDVPGTDHLRAYFTFFDATDWPSNGATVLWTGASGTAECRTQGFEGPPVVDPLPGASVKLYSGSVLLAQTKADSKTAKYKFGTLAANSTYTVRYTSTDGTKSCGVIFTTDANGSANVPEPAPVLYRQNSTWLNPYELTNSVPTTDSDPSGKSRWYVLRNIPAQSQVNVSLTAAEVDLSLVAYRNVRAVAARLNALTAAGNQSQINVQTLTASQDIGADDMAGDDMAGDDMAGDDMAGGGPGCAVPCDLAVFSDVYTTAQPPSTLAVSATPGRAAEFLSINARAGGDLYFRVRKSVRELSPAEGHYSITASYLAAPGCNNDAARAALAAPYAATAISAPSGKSTLILTNTTGFGLAGADKTNFLQLLTGVANKSYVNGTVYDLSTNTGVMTAYNAWVASADTRGCVELANRVTDVIKNVVNQFRQSNPIQYGVSAGGDKIIPLRRVLDRVPPPLKTEVQYSPPLTARTAVDASLAGNYYLTADFYAATSPITRFGGEVWLPEFSWGLLVESPADIKAYLDTFVAANGLVQNPGKALSMGFDWNADLAKAIRDDIAATGANVTSVINTTTPPGYTATDIKTNLTSLWATAGFLGVQGHATATSLKAADNATHLYSTDVAAVAAGQPKTTGIVVTLGCHSAFNIQDGDVSNPLVQTLAWPEAFMAQGKTLLGGTGYQYAETILIKNTERLLQLFTHELRFVRGIDAQGKPLADAYPNGEVPIGDAHVNAKRLYMADFTAFTGLDQKVLGVSQIFGMPMLRYNLPGTSLERSPSQLITPTDLGGGLSTADITQSFTLNRCNAGGCSGVNAGPSYFAESPQLTHSVAFRPIIARKATSVDATFPTVARGAVIMNATFTQTSNVSPLTSIPVTEQPGTAPPYVSPVFNPWPVALNEYVNQQLVWLPTQYRSDANGSFDLVKFTNSTTKVYYSSVFGPTALVDAPVFRNIDVSASGNTVHLVITLQGHTSVGIETLWATSLGSIVGESCQTAAVGGSGNPCFISQAPTTVGDPVTDPQSSDRFTRTFTFDINAGSAPGTLAWRGFFQAVGGNAVVRLANNLGALYRVIPPTATISNPKIATQLVGSAPASAVYRSFISASATLTSGTVAVANKPVTFRLGSVSRTATTNNAGVASVQLPGLAVEVLPRTTPYRLLIGFAEDDSYLASGTGLDIIVSQAPTQFTLATSPIPAGGSGFLAKLCLSSDAGCIGSGGGDPSPPGINEHLVQIDITGIGSVLTTTDGFGRVLLDTLDFGGLPPANNYTGTITAIPNRLYKETSVTISFSTSAQTFTKDRAVQGQGNFTTGSNSVGIAPGSPATFEFNVSLPKDSAIPNGKNLGFQVKPQNFDFVATSYEWMTIVGNRAIVAGRGTLTVGTVSTRNVPYWMIVDDFATGDRYEIRIGGTFQSSQYLAASSVKSSAVTIK
jgi:hypothetical protein